MKKTVFALLLVLSGCSTEKNMIIAVAANFRATMNEIVSSYQKKYKSENIRLIIGSSGKLVAQIRAGAPYCIFLSANRKHPEMLYREGRGMDRPKVYARGGLALFFGKKTGKREALNRQYLKSLPRMVIANPKLAPYGEAAMDVLKRFSGTGILARLVLTPNITRAFTTARFSKDAALVARSLLLQPGTKDKYPRGQTWIAVDSKLHKPIEQALIILKPCKFPKRARRLAAYLDSPAARKIILKYGYSRKD